MAIFLAVKNTQSAFNGYGAQETCDMLFEAILHPLMPAYLVCQNDTLWKRLCDAVISYQKGRLDLATGNQFPIISKSTTIQMRSSAHERFLRTIYCYRKKTVKVDKKHLEDLRSLGLLDPHATIQEDGRAIGEP